MNSDATTPITDMGQPISDRPAQGSLLSLDEQTFRANFNRAPFTIQHHLVDHRLFRLEELVGLAQRLPPEHVKYNAGDIPVSQGLYKGPQTGLSVKETIRQIEECKSWMVLKWVESDQVYRELLDSCLDEIQRLSEPLDPGMCMREGFIFVSSPAAVTPYHMDPEYNFLLQIRGTKTVHIFDGSDRSILSEEELEEFLASSGDKNLTFKEEFEARSSVFDLLPGMGLHFPVTAPHWVQNGDQVSISFSITFRTLASERRNVIYDFNSRLRQHGLRPTPFSKSRLRDSAKFHTYRALRKARSFFNRDADASTPKRTY